MLYFSDKNIKYITDYREFTKKIKNLSDEEIKITYIIDYRESNKKIKNLLDEAIKKEEQKLKQKHPGAHLYSLKISSLNTLLSIKCMELLLGVIKENLSAGTQRYTIESFFNMIEIFCNNVDGHIWSCIGKKLKREITNIIPQNVKDINMEEFISFLQKYIASLNKQHAQICAQI